MNGPKLDNENNHEPDLTAFNTEDIHGYVQLGRRLAITGVFALSLLTGALGIWLLATVTR